MAFPWYESFMRQLLKRVLRRLGYDIHKIRTHQPEMGDLPREQIEIIDACRPFTLTSTERMAALCNVISYLTNARIPGDIAECGVWRGGSMMIIARMLLAAGDVDRNLYLYDTFEGMSEPTKFDASLDGTSARQQLDATERGTGVWCEASIEDVRRNLLSTGYPEERIHLIKGKVEETLPARNPGKLALLRLDTDWYESTLHELMHLYPLLQEKGILVIDDYGHWQGCRKAVDEFFEGQRVFLHRIDYTGRLLVKEA